MTYASYRDVLEQQTRSRTVSARRACDSRRARGIRGSRLRYPSPLRADLADQGECSKESDQSGTWMSVSSFLTPEAAIQQPCDARG